MPNCLLPYGRQPNPLSSVGMLILEKKWRVSYICSEYPIVDYTYMEIGII